MHAKCPYKYICEFTCTLQAATCKMTLMAFKRSLKLRQMRCALSSAPAPLLHLLTTNAKGSSTKLPQYPSTPLPISPQPSPPSERAKFERVTPYAPTPTPTSFKLDEDQPDGQTNEGERRGRPTEAGNEGNETEKHGGVVGEIEEARGKPPPPPFALVRHGKCDDELGEHGVAHANVSAVERRVSG